LKLHSVTFKLKKLPGYLKEIGSRKNKSLKTEEEEKKKHNSRPVVKKTGWEEIKEAPLSQRFNYVFASKVKNLLRDKQFHITREAIRKQLNFNIKKEGLINEASVEIIEGFGAPTKEQEAYKYPSLKERVK
jgi:hypothetical protein